MPHLDLGEIRRLVRHLRRRPRRFTALVVLCLAAVLMTVPAQATTIAKKHPGHHKVQKVIVPKPKCFVYAVTYNDQSALVTSTGSCFIPRYKGHKKVTFLPTKWSWSYAGYDVNGVTPNSSNSHAAGGGSSFTLNPARFYTVNAVFTIATPRTKTHPGASKSLAQTVQTGGTGTVTQPLGSSPGTTPPTDGSLCPFTDPCVEMMGGGQCGTAALGACAFLAPPTRSQDVTIQAGRWACPAPHGACTAADATGPYQWFGYNVYSVAGSICGDPNFYAQLGVADIMLGNSDGGSCTLHVRRGSNTSSWDVATFRLPAEWGGTLKVTFVLFTVNLNGGNLSAEYETGQFLLNGNQNGCNDSRWKIEPAQ